MNERDIFIAARQLQAPQEQNAYLDKACGGDHELRRRIVALLEEQAQLGSFLEHEQPLAATLDAPHCERRGSVIGPYKLIEQIGEGGMAVVWMAQQTEPVKRLVALKLIKAGMASKQLIARFEAERQALALMDHPNIAKVFDGGTIGTSEPRPSGSGAEPRPSGSEKAELRPSGSGAEPRPSGSGAEPRPSGSGGGWPLPFGRGSDIPYFVMDLVKGVPITRYCDEHRLTVRERLELFLPVCQAVQHAHQKGIIHRDIKPSNVLVALYDGKPVPKVIDFGVAKAIGQPLTEQTLVTGFGAIVGTLEYMSPEQAEINQLDVDTRSDIYSLGVLLYELLTGTTPLEHRRVKESGLIEALRIIREEEVPTLSNRLSSTAELPAIAANRGTEPKKLTKLVRGELDWIVMRALEKDRNQRYETASALAADVQRYLNDEPVLAGPPSVAYRVRKFARRNKRAALGLAALVVGATVSSWQAVRATIAERAANAERERASDAEQHALKESARARAEAEKAAREEETSRAVNEFLIVDLLAQADPYIEPDREIKLSQVVDRAAAKVDSRFRDRALAEAAVRTALGRIYESVGNPSEAERQLKRAWELYRGELGEEHPTSLRSASVFASVHRSPAQGTALLMKTLAAQRRVLGEQHPDVLRSMHRLAIILDLQEKPLEGLVIMDKLLPQYRAVYGRDHPATLVGMITLANILRKVGRRAEAVSVYQEAREVSRRINGPDHVTTLVLEDNLAISFQQDGRFFESLRLRLRVVDARRRVLGERHPQTIWSLRWLWDSIREHVAAGRDRTIGARVTVALVYGMTEALPESGAAWTALGMAHLEAGDYEAAIAALHKSVEFRVGGGPVDWLLLAQAYARSQRRAEARQWYDKAVGAMEMTEDLQRFQIEAAVLLDLPPPSRVPQEPGEAVRVSTMWANWDEAAAAYSELLDRLPPGLGYHSERKRACLELAGADELFERLLKRRPKDAQLWIARGRIHMAQLDWQAAADAYRRSIDAHPIDDETFEYAALLGLLDEGSELESFLRRTIARKTEILGCYEWYCLARAAAVVPQQAVPTAEVVRLARDAVAVEERAWFRHVLALALYRAGDYQGAIAESQRSDDGRWTRDGFAVNALVRAASLARIGDCRNAQAEAEKARKLLEPWPHRHWGACNPEWLEAQLLLREVNTLLGVTGGLPVAASCTRVARQQEPPRAHAIPRLVR